MTVTFQDIPTDFRVPLVAIEVTGSASTAQSFRSLLVGQKTSAGSATANTPVQVTSYGHAIALFGAGSQLALMVHCYLQNDPAAELWALPLADNGSGTAGVVTITVDTASAVTEAGTAWLYVAGRRIAVPVSVGDTDAEIAIAISDALTEENARLALPFTHAITDDSDDNKVVLTYRHKGASAAEGQSLIAFNRGPGEAFPAGMALTSIAQTAVGASEPSVSTAITNMGDVPYHFIAWPYFDTTTLGLLTAELARRWGALVQAYGVAFAAKRGSSSTVTTLTANYDEKALTILGFDGALAPSYLRATAYCAQAAKSGRQIPSQPLTTLELRGVDVTPPASDYTLTQRNTMHINGAATASRDETGLRERISVPTTTYQTTESGAPSTTFWRIERTVTAMRYAMRLKAALQAQFARAILVADGTPVSAGTPVATPSAIRQAFIAQHDSSVLDGWVQNPEGFAESILVEIDDENPGRVNVYCEPALADQLTAIAAKLQFQG